MVAFKWVCAVIAFGALFIRQYRIFKFKRCKSKRTIQGKTVVITGANSGIGKSTALELAKRKARVILACRDINKALQAAAYIRRFTKEGELVIKHLDLASFKSIRNFADDICKTEGRLDILINNAGIYHCPFICTEDGFETQFGVNHLGHFLLTNLLLNLIKQSEYSRIITVTSALHKNGQINFADINRPSEITYEEEAAYNQSKLANILFAIELDRRLRAENPDSNVSVFSLQPGMVYTNLARYVNIPIWKKICLAPMALFFLRTPFEGCQTVLHCALEEELDGISGKYFVNCTELPFTPVSQDEVVAKKLWNLSTEMTGLNTVKFY